MVEKKVKVYVKNYRDSCSWYYLKLFLDGSYIKGGWIYRYPYEEDYDEYTIDVTPGYHTITAKLYDEDQTTKLDEKSKSFYVEKPSPPPGKRGSITSFDVSVDESRCRVEIDWCIEWEGGSAKVVYYLNEHERGSWSTTATSGSRCDYFAFYYDSPYVPVKRGDYNTITLELYVGGELVDCKSRTVYIPAD